MPIYIRISHRGSTKYLSLGEHVAPSYWSEARARAKRSLPRAPALNEYLSRAEREAERIVTRLQAQGHEPTARRVKERLSMRLGPESETPDFLSFCRKVVARYEARGQSGTARLCRSVVNKVEEFAQQESGQSRVPFDELDVGFLERYQTWEVSEPPAGRGNAQSTAHKALSKIRMFCNTAIREGAMDPRDYPFRNFTMRQGQPAQRSWLHKDEVRALANVRTEAGTLRRAAQQVFLFQYYAWGMRVGDALLLTWEALDEENRRLRYQMSKTGKHLDLPLTERALQIARQQDEAGAGRVFWLMDRYDLENASARSRGKESRTAKMNEHLKTLAEEARIEKPITTHTARHSAACAMYQEWRDVHRVKRYLGHSSVTVTERYLRSMEGIRLGDEGEWEDVL